jgi:adenylate cyclase
LGDVQLRHPDPACAMSTVLKEIEAVIAFADVARSTMLYERLGDQRARAAIAQCIEIMSRATVQNHGIVVKTIGDEVMAAFRAADDAAAALVQIQDEITDRLSVDGHPLAVRAGFHAGRVLAEAGDVFGDAVNTAARIVGQAKAGQILTTGATVDLLSAERQASARQIDKTAVRGKRNPIAIFELVRSGEEATRMISAASLYTLTVEDRMVLRLGTTEMVVGAEKEGATLGRADQNDLVLIDELVSRQHARVECRRGRFFLVDQSVNGTFVVRPGAEPAWVHREEFPLDGAGLIGLGRTVSDDDPGAISFSTVR